MKVPSKNPPFFTGWILSHLPWAAEILRISTVQRLGHTLSMVGWGWTSTWPASFPYMYWVSASGYIYIICIYWVPSPLSGKPSISHLPTQAKVRWATVGPWFAEGKLGGSSMGFTPVSVQLWSSPKFNSWPLENDAWRTIHLLSFLGWYIFRDYLKLPRSIR